MVLSAVIPLWAAAVVFVLLLTAAVIGFVAADAMRDEIERQDVQLKQDVSVMRGLQSKMSTLAEQCASPAAAQAVKKAAEALRYSDPVSREALQEIETELSTVIEELQQAVFDGDERGILTLCRKLEITLTERNRLCKLTK